MSTSFGYMGKQKPYIIFTRPVKKPPLDFNYMCGYPSNVSMTINQLKETGYAEIEPNTLNIKLVSGITNDEETELQDMLTNGVFFS